MDNGTDNRFCFEHTSGPTLETTVSNTSPLECTVPGSVVTVTVEIANPSNTLQAGAFFSSSLPPQLLALPASCASNVGTCTVRDGAGIGGINYAATLAPNQTARITYQARVADGTSPGAVLCIVTVPGTAITGSCRTSTACITVNCPPGGSAPICLQDDNSGDLLRFNSLTGEYLFTKCGADGYSLSGRGSITRRGCSIELHNPQISATIDKCLINPHTRGEAMIRLTPLGPTIIINDRNINNNTCACP